MSQHSEKKIVINGAQCFPALYLNESSIGAFPSPLLFPHSCGSRPPRLQARAPGRQARQQIPAAAGPEARTVVRAEGGRSEQGDFPWPE